MVHGSWFMVHGLWFMVHGSWFMVHGSWVWGECFLRAVAARGYDAYLLRELFRFAGIHYTKTVITALEAGQNYLAKIVFLPDEEIAPVKLQLEEQFN